MDERGLKRPPGMGALALSVLVFLAVFIIALAIIKTVLISVLAGVMAGIIFFAARQLRHRGAAAHR